MFEAISAAIEIRIDAAKRAVLESAIRAKKSHGVDVSADRARLDAWRYEGPTLVAAVRLTGWVEHDMYDEHPGLAYFKTNTSVDVQLGLLSLAAAKSMMVVSFLEKAWHGEWFERAEYDSEGEDDEPGLRTDVSGLVLIDNLGRVVAEATVNCTMPENAVRWTEESTCTEGQAEALKVEAEALQNEASEEARWDNFDSAASLRGQASYIRRRLEVASSVGRLAA